MEFIENQKAISALYESVTDEARKKRSLTRAAFDVLMFLKNNPRYDTAAQIVKYRRLAKSQVSGAVAELSAYGLLTAAHAEGNKKTVRLALTAKGEAAAEDGKRAQREFAKILFCGFEKSEIEGMKAFFARAKKNAESYFEEKKCR